MNDLVNKVFFFLKKNISFKKPVLLAYSGGPDSEALLHVLLACREKKAFPLHLAHVDHGWREKSRKEAFILKKKAEKFNLCFFLKELNMNTQSENLARKYRYEFFQELRKKNHYEVLLTAHHKDDVIETVLKRIFEGAFLTFLSGLDPIKIIDGLKVLRPFHDISKSQIFDFLECNHLDFFDDETNRDQRFLRARIRDLLPVLSKSLGKEIKSNLYLFNQRSYELKKYFDEKIQSYIRRLGKNDFFSCYDLQKLPHYSLEKIHLLKSIFQQENLSVSYNTIEQILFHLKQNNAHKKLRICQRIIYIDRGFLFFIYQLPLKEDLEVFYEYAVTDRTRTNWTDLFADGMELILPEGEYEIDLPIVFNKKIKEWRRKERAPLFLRNIIPCVYEKGKLIGDFLTGKKNKLSNQDTNLCKIKIQFKK